MKTEVDKLKDEIAFLLSDNAYKRSIIDQLTKENEQLKERIRQIHRDYLAEAQKREKERLAKLKRGWF